ncbi:hypothetical protein H310_00744 [Aphanomyces invadans]|uniref:Uncharacterized protein n=1 Tax=Aphanomyces invadans TaxID=157072 RepID=A0A024UVU1_9STRA|nr:hypothetical protein H310_00744 [Aphanomyces invadans]ETW10439.1 hypothetical protein H310_00744 [Aphanomyces invadans]|eukprot:XP_008861850.1 hypothetical protein H310_00744 [Aphanomyces invadans]
MQEYDKIISGRVCQARCDGILDQFGHENQKSMRASGVDDDADDLTKLKQDVHDQREDAKSKRTRKRESEQDRQDELDLAGEGACNEAEERVSKRMTLGNNPTASKRDTGHDPTDLLLAFETKRHEDDHAYRMQRLKFEQEEQEYRRNEQRQMAKLLEKHIDKLGD